ncbi:hypothetical protein DFQ26_000894 [Actinomortierella ambigua]|nr:hypothetical protein DFQ26_000894 [Actinomortierella ambigua]
MPSQAILLDETEEKNVEMDLDSEFSVAEVSDIDNKENNPPSGIPVHPIANDSKDAVPFSSPFTFSFPMPPSHAIKCGEYYLHVYYYASASAAHVNSGTPHDNAAVIA